MASELTEYEPQGGALAAPSQSSNLLAQIVDAARDPTVDADKMKAMTELAIRLQDREHEQQFNRDFNAALIEMPVITKTGRIEIPGKGSEPGRVQGTYAKFEDLNRVVKPILARNNLSIAFEVGGTDSRITVAPIISHRNGMTRKYPELPLPLETSGSKNNVQGVGSSIAYGKRYALTSVLNISVEGQDDDGSGGKVIMPEERGNLVIEEAQAAFDEDRYGDWFKMQSPKDRGWLVTAGHHARFGGAGPALAGTGSARRQPAPEPDPPAAKDVERSPVDESVAAADWTKRYVAKIGQCASLDTFGALQLEFKERLDRIKAAYPALWNDISFAHGSAYDRLSGNQDDSSAGDLFAGGDE